MPVIPTGHEAHAGREDRDTPPAKPLGGVSDSLDDNITRVRRQGAEVGEVGGEHRATRLCHRNYERIDRGSPPCQVSEESGSSRQTLGYLLDHVAYLQEPVGLRIFARMTVKGFDQYRSGDDRRPCAGGPQGRDKSDAFAGPLREPGYRARVQNQQVLTGARLDGFALGPPGDAAGQGLCPGVVLRVGLSDLVEDLGQIGVGFTEQPLPSKLDPDRLLQQSGRREPAVLDLTVEVVR